MSTFFGGQQLVSSDTFLYRVQGESAIADYPVYTCPSGHYAVMKFIYQNIVGGNPASNYFKRNSLSGAIQVIGTVVSASVNGTQDYLLSAGDQLVIDASTGTHTVDIQAIILVYKNP